MFTYTFLLADILIRVRVPVPLSFSETVSLFLVESRDVDLTIDFAPSTDVPNLIDKPLYVGTGLQFYRQENKYITTYSYYHSDIYTWSYGQNIIYYQPHLLSKLFQYADLLNLLSLESILLRFQSFMLHASYIEYHNEAILFSAPSGTGKSTQASLWEAHAGAKIINGDRALLRKRDNTWFSHGSPFCGTSGISHPTSLPIKAIFILRQGQKNHTRLLSPAEAVLYLFSETITHIWDEEAKSVILSLLEHLVATVPIYFYECLPLPDAVYYIQKMWEETC